MRFLNALLILTLTGTLMVGCDFFEQRDRTFNDDPKLEFKPLAETVDEGGSDGNSDVSVATDIQLIGPQRDSDLTANFVVADSSTAEEGVHYSLSSTSATIEANSSSAEVGLTVLDNNQDDGDTNYELFLVLQESDGVEPAENFKTYTLTIRGADE